jgi:hypothetical protein
MKRFFFVIALSALLLARSSSASISVYSADSFAGADASVQINACIAAVIAAGGGTCDASMFIGMRAMSQEVSVGSASSVAKHVGLTLLLPDTATWVWHLTDGVSCGLHQFSSTAIIGKQPGAGGSRMVLTVSSGANMDSIYCTDGAGYGSYVRAEGFAIWNNQDGSSFANGVVHIRGVADETSFTRIFAENYYGDVWHIESACCGARFEGIQGISNGAIANGAIGGVPLTIGPGKVHNVSIYDSTFNQPGISYPDVLIQGGTLVFGINFFNLYMEGNGAVDPATSMVYISAGVGPVHFFGGMGNTEQGQLSSTKTVFENHGARIDVPAFEVANTTLGINDLTGATKIAVKQFNGNLGSIPSYSTLLK